MSAADLTRFALISEARPLDNGWRLVTAVAPDGSTWPWLLGDGPDSPQESDWSVRAPHELLGPLPSRTTATTDDNPRSNR